MQNIPATGFVRLPTVLQHIPVSRSTWWEGVRNGRFPSSVKIGGVTAWRVEDIHALIEQLFEQSFSVPGKTGPHGGACPSPGQAPSTQPSPAV
jgi:predicted DNA-binding transcriptional regulator AlpA